MLLFIVYLQGFWQARFSMPRYVCAVYGGIIKYNKIERKQKTNNYWRFLFNSIKIQNKNQQQQQQTKKNKKELRKVFNKKKKNMKLVSLIFSFLFFSLQLLFSFLMLRKKKKKFSILFPAYTYILLNKV